jgi:two-component SAPR family response regulator
MRMLAQAVELYRGDYLQRYSSDWCLVRRENLRAKYEWALARSAGRRTKT